MTETSTDTQASEELWMLAVDELHRRNLGRIADHFAAALAEVRALRAELSACRDWQAKRVVAISQDPMCIRWLRQSEQAEEEVAAAEAERDSALAQVAAVRALHQKQSTYLSGGGGAKRNRYGYRPKYRSKQFLGTLVEYCGRCQNPEIQRWPCSTIAALSQSGLSEAPVTEGLADREGST